MPPSTAPLAALKSELQARRAGTGVNDRSIGAASADERFLSHGWNATPARPESARLRPDRGIHAAQAPAP